MNGEEILEHFRGLLRELESGGGLPAAQPVLRFPAAPQHLHSLTSSSYHGTPAVFPASWALPAVRCLPCLTSLLGGILQVEVFRLDYGTVNEEASSSSFQEPLQSARSDNFAPSMSCSAFKGLDSSQQAESSGHSKPHPIPSSTTETMDFQDFALESSFLMKFPKNQLLYLTWRSLPDHSLPASMPDDFCSFIDGIIHPLTTPPFIAPESIKQRNMWMGSLVTSRIHFDALDNVHVCLSGKKVVHLYSPSELPNLYPKPWSDGSTNNFSQIGSALIANKAKHSRYFQNAKRFKAEINPGEAIFIPAGWWHEVFTLQQSLSVNVWFGPSPNAAFRPTLLHLKSDKYLKFMLRCAN